MREKYSSRGFQVLAVDADDDESRETVQAFVTMAKLTHPIAIRGARAMELYDEDGVMPLSFWIDPRGVVVLREVGFLPGMEKHIEETILEFLKKKDEARSAEKRESP